MHYGYPVVFDREVEEILATYDWPGNVREMENVVDRALILADEGRVTIADLPQQLACFRPAGGQAPVLSDSEESLRDQVRRFESSVIGKAIADAEGDRRVAAQQLGIGLSSLYRKLEEYEALGLLSSQAEDRTAQR
jgi:two-component system response regulator AtoC